MRMWRAGAIGLLAAGCAVSCQASAAPLDRSAPALRALPRLVLWAWQRPEDLRGLGAHRAGVAYLAATYRVSGGAVRVEPRTLPLLVDPDTPIVAVARLEVEPASALNLTPAATDELAQSLVQLPHRPGVLALQIDFDAKASERGFYKDLIVRTRRALGGVPLSVTALTSWCLDDAWMDPQAVDEIVPMLFRLGVPGGALIKSRGAEGTLPNRACGGAVGVSLDEPTPPIAPGRRVYVFSPTAWTPASSSRALDQFGGSR
jgi:hypothetical protein